MNRFEILILDRHNGVIVGEYMDVPSMLSFFHRCGRVRQLQVIGRKGEKAIFIDKIDPATITNTLNEFIRSQQ